MRQRYGHFGLGIYMSQRAQTLFCSDKQLFLKGTSYYGLFILLELEFAALLRLTSRRPHVLRVHSRCLYQPRLAANPITSSIIR